MTNEPIIDWADVPALGDNHVRVSERVKREFGDILLTTGAWGTMRMNSTPPMNSREESIVFASPSSPL